VAKILEDLLVLWAEKLDCAIGQMGYNRSHGGLKVTPTHFTLGKSPRHLMVSQHLSALSSANNAHSLHTRHT
jgi:hypothetical protein